MSNKTEAASGTESSRAERGATSRQIALHMAVVSGLFCALVAVLLLVNHYRIVRADPLTSVRAERLDSLAKRHLASPRDESIKREIRALDQRIRQEFFDRQAVTRTGGYLLIGGLIVLVLSLRRAAAFRAPPGTGAGAGANRKARLVLAGGAVLLGAAALGIGFLGYPGLPEVYSEKAEEGAAGDGRPESRPAPVSIGPAEWARNWPAFRGPDNSGVCRFENIPDAWNEAEGRNIRWKVKVPLGGLSSPVVWGNRVFLTGATRAKRETYCFDAESGKLLWTGTYASDPKAPGDYDVWEDLESLMHAVPTPVVDGRRMFAYYNNGEVACFDAGTGKCLWSRFLGGPEGNSYGLSSSLLIHRDTLIVLHDSEENRLFGLHAATGEEKWRSTRDSNTWASPILIRAPDATLRSSSLRSTSGRRQIVISANPLVSGWDPATGERLWYADLLAGDVAPSPIYAQGRVIACFEACGVFAIRPDGAGEVTGTHVKWRLEELEAALLPAAESPVADGDFVYLYAGDFLACIDGRTGEVLYEKEMEEPASYASPVIADKKLYAFGQEKTYVIRVGREYALLGTCSLKERFHASPAFAPGRIFFRGFEHLYCISKDEE